MSYTVVKPEQRSKGSRTAIAGKMFKDGEEKTYPRGNGILYWSEVKRVDSPDSLMPLYNTLKDIEDNNLNQIIIAERVLKKGVYSTDKPVLNEDGSYTDKREFEANWFQLRVKDFLEQNIQRNWIQLDFDTGPKGCNSLPLDQRLKMATAGLPEAFTECEMVGQLSNKAGMVDAFPNYMALRLFFLLETPYTNAQLRDTLSGLDFVDTSVFTNGRRHYVRRPALVNTEVSIEGDTLFYRKGRKLDLRLLERDKNYRANREHSRTLVAVTRNFTNFKSDGEQIEELRRIAKEGFWDGGRSRHTAHYKMIKKAEWTNQNGQALIEAILEGGSGDGTVLGNVASKESLYTKLDEIQDELRNYFHYDLSNQKYDEYLPDPKSVEAADADLNPLKECLSRNLDEGNQINLAISVPHGWGKTTAIIPLIDEVLTKHLGRPARILYICTLRSIILGTCRQLSYECYIYEDGEIQKHVIDTADKLGICIKSLTKLDARKNYFDATISDESEEMGMWTLFENGGDVLRDYTHLSELRTDKNTLINVYQDADAGELTYEQIRRVLEYNKRAKSVYFGTEESWIESLHQTMNWYRKERELLNRLYDDAVTRDKFCFVHVDFDDKKSNPRLTALANAYNALAGKEICKIFWKGTSRSIKQRLFEDKDRYLTELYEQGVRIIIVSPIIVSGWRYRGQVNFDATYGIYLNNIQTAPAIIQRTQRVINCREHHLYVNPRSNYTNLDQLLEDYAEDVQWNDLEHAVYMKPHEADAKVLTAKAGVKRSKQKDNVKLHTIYLWEHFGGQHIFHEYDDERRDELQILSDAIKEAKDAERYRQAEIIYHDEHKLQVITDAFKEYSEALVQYTEKSQPKSVEEVLTLLKILDRTVITQPTSEQVMQLLTTTEEVWKHWDLSPPIKEWNEQTLKDFYELVENERFTMPKHTYRILGRILREMVDQLPGVEASSLLRVLARKEAQTIVVDTTELDDVAYKKIINNHIDILKSKLPELFENGAVAMDKIIVRLFRKVLHCDVKVETAKSGEVTQLKKDLVLYYQKHGHLAKGDCSKRALQNQAKNILAQRIRDSYELSDLEQEYLEGTGKLITIEMPDVIPTVMANLIEASYVRNALDDHNEADNFSVL